MDAQTGWSTAAAVSQVSNRGYNFFPWSAGNTPNNAAQHLKLVPADCSVFKDPGGPGAVPPPLAKEVCCNSGSAYDESLPGMAGGLSKTTGQKISLLGSTSYILALTYAPSFSWHDFSHFLFLSFFLFPFPPSKCRGGGAVVLCSFGLCTLSYCA